MSYILDALRKADAQRERDPARGIHAQPQPGAVGAPGRPRAPAPWVWGGVAIGAVVLASAGWYLHQEREARQVTSPAHVDRGLRQPAAGSVPAAGVAAPVVGSAVLPPPIAANGTVLPGTRIEPPAPVNKLAPPPRDPRATSLPTMRGSQSGPGAPATVTPRATAQRVADNGTVGTTPAAVSPTAAAGVAPTGPGAVSPTVPGAVSPPTTQGAVSGPPQGSVSPGMPGAPSPTPPMPTAPAPTPVAPPSAVFPGTAATPRAPAPLPPPPPAAPSPPVVGLPADAPKLVISGGVYSNSPTQRMLIVNGTVFNEGSEVGPGVVLEQIKPKTAVLRFRGSRYTVNF